MRTKELMELCLRLRQFEESPEWRARDNDRDGRGNEIWARHVPTSPLAEGSALRLLRAASKLVRQQAAAKEYQAWDLLCFKKWPIAKVARCLGVSALSVYLIKHRVTVLMKKGIAQLRDQPA